MGKVLYSATTSLDGFIADPGGDMSWLTEHLGPDAAAEEIIGEIDALLVGNRTFRGDDPHKGTTQGASRSAGVERTAVRAHPPTAGGAGSGDHLRQRPRQRYRCGEGRR